MDAVRAGHGATIQPGAATARHRTIWRQRRKNLLVRRD
jgi:hypothetical protein